MGLFVLLEFIFVKVVVVFERVSILIVSFDDSKNFKNGDLLADLFFVDTWGLANSSSSFMMPNLFEVFSATTSVLSLSSGLLM